MLKLIIFKSTMATKQSKTKLMTPEVHVRVVKVSHAKEVPNYKALPKYNHVPLACINPSPKKPKTAV